MTDIVIRGFDLADCEQAIALYQSCGFTIEGTARNFCLRDGAMVDAHYMARLKPS